MSTPRIAVTGATGAVGGRVARTLAAQGIPQLLVVRDASRAPALPDASVAVASYDEPDALLSAFTGIETLFFVSGAENPDRLAQHFVVVDAAAAAGVQHVVYTSFFGAAPDCTFTLGRDHWATEERLRTSGVGWTFLRDNLYADFLKFLPGEDGVIRGPGGDGRVSVVAQADVSDVAAAVLVDAARHVGTAYDMTGPEALSFPELAEQISAATGRTITFHNETVEEAYASRAVYNAPDWQVDAWVSTYTAIAKGEMAGVSVDVERILGRPPRSLATVLAG